MAKKIVTQPGDRYGRWTVLEKLPSRKYEAYWLCRCDCGAVAEVPQHNLHNGQSKSCGCLRVDVSISKGIAKAGDRYGRLVLVSKIRGKRPGNHWLCRCDCGVEKELCIGHLQTGNTRSCGCLNSELVIERRTKHGYAQVGKVTPEFKIWTGMKNRVLNPKEPGFKNYGGRGVRICDRWLEAFTNFLEDMGPLPEKGYSIERVDVNGDYEPSNCVWVPRRDQARNRRVVHIVEYRGRVFLGASSAAKSMGVAPSGLVTNILKGKSTVAGRSFVYHGRVGDVDPEILERAA